MSLVFGAATSNAVSLDAGLDNKHNFSTIQWVMPTTLSARQFFGKGGAKDFYMPSTTGSLEFDVACATTTATRITATGIIAINTWYFLATTYKSSEKIPRIYLGKFGAGVAEQSSGGSNVTGVGAENTDTAQTWCIGNKSNLGTVALQGNIAFFAHFGRALSLGELQRLFYISAYNFYGLYEEMPYLYPYCDIWMHLGRTQSNTNTGRQLNLSTFGSPVRGSSAPSGTTLGQDPPYKEYFSGNVYDDTDESLIISAGGVTLLNRAKCGVGI
jgi:hypothetical protein